MTTIYRDKDVVAFSTRNLSSPKSNGGMILEQTIGNEKELSTLSSRNENVVEIIEIPSNPQKTPKREPNNTMYHFRTYGLFGKEYSFPFRIEPLGFTFTISFNFFRYKNLVLIPDFWYGRLIFGTLGALLMDMAVAFESMRAASVLSE